jgi:non-ribosomal peptide synthase protein (TIGR01720 family)
VGVKRLATSHAFHSGMMREAAQVLSQEMEGLARGTITIPYISNVSGSWAQVEEVRDGEYWGRQMLERVQWWRGVEEVLASGARVLLEVGPGESLKTVVKEGVRGRDVAVLSTLQRKRHGAEGEEAERAMVSSLGEMWARGVGVKWGGMYAGEERRRVELPTYEFERKRYWVEPLRTRSNGEREEAQQGRAKLEKWFYVPVWKQSVGQRRQGTSEASGQKWLVLREESGVSDELVAQLEAAGADVVSVRRGREYELEEEKRYVIKGDSREEYERLVAELEERGWRAERVVHLWSVTNKDEERIEEGRLEKLDRMQERGFYSLLFLAQALGKQILSESLEEEKKADPLQITVVSNNMQSVSGEEELQPEKATVLGPCRVIGQEYPRINCRSIDVVLDERRPAAIVKQLLDELLSENTERIVAYRGRYRWVQVYEHVKLDHRAMPVRLRKHGVYVITGGLGGVGLVLAEHMVEVAQAKLVLISRSAFPERTQWEQWLESHEENDSVSVKIRKLQRLEEHGGEVFVAQADVANSDQMQKVWAQARGRFGSLHGVIHAAGNPPEGLIQLKSREKAAEVLSPKVRGTVVLDSLCRNEGVDFIVLCSSLSSILALPGRIDYCAANAFLDAYAHSKNIDGNTFTVSINWDGWEEVGMGTNSTLRSDALNGEYSVEGMLSSEGVDVFDRILSGDLPQVVVSVVDLPARVRRHDAITAEASLEKLKQQRTILPTHARPHLRNEYVAPRNEVEQIIAGIWQSLLGIDQIGVEDNFFELGGDSVQSIQIIARANQAGMQLTPKQVFEHQTIAELAAVAGKGKTIAVEQSIVSGEAQLTPIQRWFFEQQPAEVNHYNQALMFNVRQRLDVRLLKQVIAGLLEHHDALRLRFDQMDGNWRQWYVAPEAGASEEVFKYIDLHAVSEAEQATAITAAAEEVQRSLNLATGPVLRIALMDLGEGREERLLIVIHHLVVDAVSWRILLEDLQCGYDQLRRGEAVNFPAKTTSCKNWAEALSKQSQTEEIRRELDYWLEMTRPEAAAALPVDNEQGLNTMAFQRSVDVKLDAELTRQLLQDVPATFNTQINDVLLTALACAFERWSGSASVLVDVEGHGREEIVEGIDVSRTVGWFTTIYPTLLEAGVEDLGETLVRTKERLRAVPRRGIGYGMLKYLNADPSIFNQLRKTVDPQVSFLYLGQFDQPLAQLNLFTEAEESRGMDHSGAIRRPHLIDFSAYVADGQLLIKLAYSEQVHERPTIERLAQNYLDALRSLITFCLSSEEMGEDIEDFYPLSSLQEGLLFHGLYAPEDDFYITQAGYRIRDLDVPAVKRAWQKIVDRHPALRTAFVWENVARPFQVVHRHVKLPFRLEDLRGLSSIEQQERLAAYHEADRRRGFQLNKAPLLRLALFQIDDNCHQLVLSHHHIILDGWSMSLVSKEAFALYEVYSQGQELQLEPSRPYRDFIAWLKQQNPVEAESFWRRMLKDFTVSTPIVPGLGNGSLPREKTGYSEQQLELSAATTAALLSLGRLHHLTMNTIVMGAWALLLSRYTGRRDVLFGVVMSGRPPDLAGVESMIGLFINTLPMRIRLSANDSLCYWLQEIQRQQVEMQAYEYSSLAEVQQWSEVPRGEPLFDNIFTFENYPMTRNETGLELVIDMSFEKTSYPLTILVSPGTQLILRMLYDDLRIDDATVKRLLQHFQSLLENMAVDFDRPVSNLQIVTPVENEQLVDQFNADLEVC